MADKKDSPGVYFPPPLLYVLTFIAAILLQKKIFIDNSLFHLQITKMAGILLLVISLFFLVTSLLKFFKSKNTLILVRPASSLQTTGVYNISRNPMYVGLAIVYAGVTCLIGNWWNVILFPFLLAIIQQYIIKKEEKYLVRAFGEIYYDYKKRVRRWL